MVCEYPGNSRSNAPRCTAEATHNVEAFGEVSVCCERHVRTARNMASDIYGSGVVRIKRMKQRTKDADAELRTELVASVKRYANENYERDGWDIVVECWSDEEIEDAIGKAQNPDKAILNVKRAVSDIAEYRREIQAEAF